jgi:hypothetical protein
MWQVGPGLQAAAPPNHPGLNILWHSGRGFRVAALFRMVSFL